MRIMPPAVLAAVLAGLAGPACSADDLAEDRRAVARRLWPQVAEARWAERATAYAVGNDLHGNVDAGRPLGEADLRLVAGLSDLLADPRNDWADRVSAADLLGTFGHRYGIPALAATLRDGSDDVKVRQAAVVALANIPDERVVGLLIDAGLGSGDGDVVQTTLDYLPQVAGVPPILADPNSRTGVRLPPGFRGEGPADPQALASYLSIWRTWWERRRDAVKLSRPVGID